MRTAILLLLNLFLFLKAISQVGVMLSKPALDTKNVDSFLGLSSVKNTNCKTFIRIGTEKQTIDIYSMNGKVFQAKFRIA